MKEFDALWIEKYRPKTLDDLYIPQSVKDEMVATIKETGNQIPHLLFVGSPGVGKTTLAQIIVNSILDCDYLYINASDENGIDTVRGKISGFSQTKSADGGVKVVILDECDFFSISAQSALRNLMESYAKYTRFILTGNKRHRISDALQSRCQSYDIMPSFRDSLRRLAFILKSENITSTPDQQKRLMSLAKKNYPDLRKTIGEMQRYSSGGVLNIPETVDASELCIKILENVKGKKGIETRKYLIENDVKFSNDYEQLCRDLINHLYDVIMDEMVKKQMIITCCEALYKMSIMVDREICFFGCLLELETI